MQSLLITVLFHSLKPWSLVDLRVTGVLTHLLPIPAALTALLPADFREHLLSKVTHEEGSGHTPAHQHFLPPCLLLPSGASWMK